MSEPSRRADPHEREVYRAFVQASTSADERALLDDHTWDDLDLDAVAERVDHAVALPGRMVLRRLLRTPTASAPTLEERERLLDVLERAPDLAEALRRELARLDRAVDPDELIGLLWGAPPEPLRFAWAFPALVLVGLLSLLAAFTIGKILIFAPVLAFVLNGAVHFRVRFRWQAELDALRFAGALLTTARRTAALRADGLEAHQRRLAEAVRQAAPLARPIALLSSSGLQDVPYEYFNMFLLLELQAYQRILVRLPRLVPALREILLTLGELDALQGVARWRSDQPRRCRPELHDGPLELEIEDGAHPLLDHEHAIPNSIALSARGALVTGANMSGKSTFLRMVGVNAVLAQTLVTCTARRYRGRALRVLSSMRVADDLVHGKSRYLAEAERLLAIVQQVGSGGNSLCLVDELLSGTNAIERLAASEAILEHLARAGALVLAATHDLELADHLGGAYDAYYFADDFASDDLRFDHRLRAGVGMTRNAVRLLERLGYPSAIVERARARAATEPGPRLGVDPPREDCDE